MKDNIDLIDDFTKYIKREFPFAIHSLDLVFPAGNANQCTFNLSELDYVNRLVPRLFYPIPQEDGEETAKKKYRCSGGISQCTVSPNGSLKICNAACSPEFQFIHKIPEYSLTRSWIDCGSGIRQFRNEIEHKTKDCIKCIKRKTCDRTDCRVMAFMYNHDLNSSNPITCYSMFHGRNEGLG